MAKIKETGFAVIYLLIGLLITRISWYAINPLLSMFEENGFLLSIAWAGLLLAFVLLVIFPPIYSLIQGTVPNLYYVGKSAISVLLGLILVRISWTVIPIFLSILGNDRGTESSILWIFVIIIWIITLIIVPVHFANEAIQK